MTCKSILQGLGQRYVLLRAMNQTGDELKCSGLQGGEQLRTIAGISMMPTLYASNWDINELQVPNTLRILDKDLETSGWIMLHALAQKKGYRTVLSEVGVRMIMTNIMKTQVSFA